VGCRTRRKVLQIRPGRVLLPRCIEVERAQSRIPLIAADSPPMPPDWEIRVEDVSVAYRRRRALRGTSWTVGRGVTALLGPNGSGKTTLLKCIVGLLKPATGSISVGAHSLTDRQGREAAHRRIGYVPQTPQLPGLSRVEDIVGYAAWLSGVPSNVLGHHLDAALAALSLTELRRRRVRTLSGGQRQRVALATGIVHAPAVLVLDEPTVGLDPGQRLRVREAIHRIGSSCTVVISTHLTEDVEHLANAVGILVDGAIRYSGPLAGLSAVTSRVTSSPVAGSDFERGYESLMASLGACDD
jgi:ABC-2 type transport system ATP-binding protein